jgi:predicted transcriptional regulator
VEKTKMKIKEIIDTLGYKKIQILKIIKNNKMTKPELAKYLNTNIVSLGYHITFLREKNLIANDSQLKQVYILTEKGESLLNKLNKIGK